MQNVATPHEVAETRALSRQKFPLAPALSVLFLIALWFGLCRELSGEWSVNEQYNFGWFVPFFALYLFSLRWQDKPPVQIPGSKTQVPKSAAAIGIAITALFLLLPIRLFEIANPEWRLLAWAHALAVVTLTLLLLWWVGGKSWVRHFVFPVAFIFIAVPWPTAVETPVIQGLMRVVAHVAAETAMLLGTPAQVEGNLIRVTNGLVGVNEACSGIRSLQTSLMIGLLFGELKRLSASRRILLVMCAIVIALVANFVRAVFLVRIAAVENLAEVNRWHDIAGYSIVLFVFLATMGVAYLLGRSRPSLGFQSAEGRTRRGEPEMSGGASSPPVLRTGCPLNLSGRMPELRLIAVALCWLVFVEVGTAGWYRIHESNLVSGIRWSVRWPEQAPNFRFLKIDNDIRAVLRFDDGKAGAWTISSPGNASDPNTIACSLYALRWSPGKNSALLANLHRPDVCLPASGWKEVADHGVRSYPVNNSVELPFRHFEFQRAFDGSAPQTAHAFYCLSEDRIAKSSASRAPTDSPGMFGNRSEWTRTERLDAVLEGRRHLGQQVIEAIFMTNEPLSAAEAETHLSNLVREIMVLREAKESL